MDNESRGDSTRRRLIDAAVELIASCGVQNTTFVEISRRCGLTRGAMHHHFDSTPDLLAEVTRTIGQRVEFGATIPMDNLDGISLADIVPKAIDSIWQQMQSLEYRALLQIRNAIAIEPSLQDEVRNRMCELNDRWYERVTRVTSLHKADATTVRVILTSMAGAASIDNAIGTPADDPDRIAYRQRLVELMLR